MLDTSQLQKGDSCLYKKQSLIYQRVVNGVKVYHVFTTRRGQEKRLSQPTTEREVWLEISTNTEQP